MYRKILKIVAVLFLVFGLLKIWVAYNEYGDAKIVEKMTGEDIHKFVDTSYEGNFVIGAGCFIIGISLFIVGTIISKKSLKQLK